MAGLKRRLRKAALLLINVAVFGALVEAGAAATYAVKYHEWFYTSHRVQRAATAPAELGSKYQLYPYFGFGLRPGVRSVTGMESRFPVLANNYGFPSQYDYPFRKTSENQFIIGIFGGSVASDFALYQNDTAMHALKTIPWLRNREIVVLNFAAGAYKQPQQLLVLNYFLSIGQHFDAVINIDGFNEVALTWVSGNAGLEASMPNAEQMLPLAKWASRDLSPQSVNELAKIYVTRAKLNTASVRAASHTSAAWQLLNSAYVKLLQREYNAQRERFEESALRPSVNENLIVNLTKRSPDSVANPIQIWANSSTQMRELLGANGILYVHVLQPNQYYASRHVFSAPEERIALSSHSPYREAVTRTYPALRAAGRDLAAHGEHFIDSVAVFDDEARPVYRDDCCHYSRFGSELFAQSIAAAIANLGDHAVK